MKPSRVATRVHPGRTESSATPRDNRIQAVRSRDATPMSRSADIPFSVAMHQGLLPAGREQTGDVCVASQRRIVDHLAQVPGMRRVGNLSNDHGKTRAPRSTVSSLDTCTAVLALSASQIARTKPRCMIASIVKWQATCDPGWTAMDGAAEQVAPEDEEQNDGYQEQASGRLGG